MWSPCLPQVLIEVRSYDSRCRCVTPYHSLKVALHTDRLYVIGVDTSHHRVDEVLTVIHSLIDVAKLRQLLVGPPLITPNTYARQNVSLDDSTQLKSTKVANTRTEAQCELMYISDS